MTITVARLRRLASVHDCLKLPTNVVATVKHLLRANGMDIKKASVRTKQRFVNNPDSQVFEFRQTWMRAKFCQETRYLTVYPDYFTRRWPIPSVHTYEVHLPHNESLRPVRIHLR